MERNPHYTRLSALVSLSEAAGFSLPDEVTTAHRAAQRLATEYGQRRADQVHGARQLLVDSFATAASTGAAWPDGRSVVEAEAADAARREERNALAQAAAAAQAIYNAAVEDVADQLIAGSLRPGVEQVLAEVADAAQALGPHGAASVEALLAAPKAAREAWLRLDGLANKYAVLRQARTLLVRTNSAADSTSLFGEVRNLNELWPTWRDRTGHPWPDDPRQRMLWLVGPDVQVWMPTPAEQAARFEEVFGDGMARMAHARLVAQGGRAPLG